jgi:hypothetical protein
MLLNTYLRYSDTYLQRTASMECGWNSRVKAYRGNTQYYGYEWTP